MNIDLKEIKSPDFLKKLTVKELTKLSDEVRSFLIDSISQTGGHLSSNLGVVELTIALHYVFDSPFDKLIFDVGHQSYTHKILTGRGKDFSTLRKYNGLSGFMKYSESEHDVWEAGHSSTSLSAAAGFLEAKKNSSNKIGEVITIIGDGAIENGLSFEALNYLSNLKTVKPIIVLNDNEMSISKNVGFLAKKCNKIRIRRSYNLLKKLTPSFLHRFLARIKSSLRQLIYGNNIFSSLGYKYFGPIDGHNIKDLIMYLNYAKKSQSPVLIHVKTIKGKGYKYAESDSKGVWHGVNSFEIDSGKTITKNNENKISWSLGVSNIVTKYALSNPNIKIICPATMPGSSFDITQELIPNQIIDVGIAEEHAVVMAAAMARNGIIPIVSMYSTFIQRAYDQINHDVCRNSNHVIFLIDRAGIVGGDGDTHQGVFDISFLSHLPNMIIAMPKNLSEFEKIFQIALEKKQPFAIRYPRGDVENTTISSTFEFKEWEEVIPISKRNIVTYGDNINAFEKQIKELKLNFGLINARFIKPIDLNMLNKLNDSEIIVYEEVIKTGSLFTQILQEINNNNLGIKCKSYSIDNEYVTHGDISSVKKDLNLDIIKILKGEI
ncbi:MAG: 1-deoxy-D-xylulose-5-phosphate synthase [Bacilli bacterium]|jgi:1-deoxy-D-xylulose-5-phosphate synthase